MTLTVNCHSWFVRSDLLDQYLRETAQRLICFVWGERDIKVEPDPSECEGWSDVLQRFENIPQASLCPGQAAP